MSSRKPLTDQKARERIVSALDRNLLVEAGAGSGKTHMMAARMAAGVASGVYQVEQMAAVTFTRKAAAELRGRFQLALEKELADSHDSIRTSRVRAALSNLERFFAGTIHSFCAHLLRERPVEAGVSPGFTEIDEVEDSLLREQVWRDFLTQGRADGNLLIQELNQAGLKPKELNDAFHMVAMYAEVDFPPGLPGETEKPQTAAAWSALDTFWAALKARLPATISQDTSCPTQKAARTFLGQLRIATVRRDRPSVLVGLLETWDFSPHVTQKWWPGDSKTTKRLRDDIEQLHTDLRDDVITPFLEKWRKYLYRLTVTLLAEARQYATAERRRRNALNYGDLLQLAAKVLRENADVRQALQLKYRWLFVDEFQDTDPVQAEIIFLLASEADVVSGFSRTVESRRTDTISADWRTMPLRPGALFVVGDPKQSIFRFRRADIEIYNTVRARLDDPPVSEVLSLTTNFRSAPALCDFANDVFQRQFPAEATPQSPKFAPLDRHRTGAGDVFTLTTVADCEQSDIPSGEAERIARYIRAEVDAGRRRFGDFLILTRKKKKNLSPYAEALERLQVPIEVSGVGAFGESKEVAQLTLLLRTLSDPQDAVSLVGTLRGPLFGISDPELFAWKQSGGWFSIFSDLGIDIGTDIGTEIGSVRLQPDRRISPVATALASLNEYFRLTRVLPAAAALERILEQSGYLALAATTPGGVEAGDLLHAVDRVRQVVADGASLAEAAQALEDDCEASSEVESLPLEPGRSDVVRLMNLHKAKGLEAAVVFLADPCGGFKPRVDIRIIRDGLTARGFFSITRDFGWKKKVIAEPAGWDVYEADEQQYLVAEESRLLYVAATRAKDMLVVSRWANAGGRGTRSWAALDPFLTAAKEFPIASAVVSGFSRTVHVDMTDDARARAAASQAAAHDRARTASWSATSVTAESKHIAAIARSADLPEPMPDDPTRVVSPDTPSHRADAGAAWGSLIHALLEHAMRHKPATRDDLRRLAMWLTVEEPELRPVIDDALDTVEAVARATFWEDAKASAERHEEVPFARRIPAEGLLQVQNGTIDLVYKRTSDWRLLDYKTDRTTTPDDLKARYQQQLDAYAEAWGSLAGGKVAAELVSTRTSIGYEGASYD